MSAADRPVVVLLPGAWHPATTWDLVRAELEPQYQTVAIALPSTDFNASADHLTDAAIVSDTVQHLADLERDIVLVTHSYGGLVGAEACKGLTRRERQAQGKKGGIAAFVAISACTFVAGQSVVTAGGGYLAPQISINKGVSYA